jgi:actin-related protein 8
VVIIHPGSGFLRIGKASDVNTITVPAVVARKMRQPIAASDPVKRIARSAKNDNSSKDIGEQEDKMDVEQEQQPDTVIITFLRIRDTPKPMHSLFFVPFS